MHFGIIGGGIVGAATASTLLQAFSKANINGVNSHHDIQITIMDDGRPNPTSQAGQGYLWSIHRMSPTSTNDFRQSMEAKQAWLDLLGEKDAEEFLHPTGSLLIASKSEEENLNALRRYYNMCEAMATTTQNNKKNGGDRILETIQDLKWIESVQSINPCVRDNVSGIYFPHDYTCSPSQLVEHLLCKKHAHQVKLTRRTVENLKDEMERFDVVICAAGPWTNALAKEDLVVPVQGLLLKVPIPKQESLNEGSHFRGLKGLTPMMEYGYGKKQDGNEANSDLQRYGVHFLLSQRQDHWLLGSSRQQVGFNQDQNILQDIEAAMMRRAHTFILSHAVPRKGVVTERRLGFRPANANPSSPLPYEIRREKNVYFMYGFEGQGVLYAAHAASKVTKMIAEQWSDS